MPLIHVDTEAAELVELALTMMSGALEARSRRADPDRIITDSLKLQANKLTGVREALRNREPAEWAELNEAARKQVRTFCEILASPAADHVHQAAYARLRQICIAPRPNLFLPAMGATIDGSVAPTSESTQSARGATSRPRKRSTTSEP